MMRRKRETLAGACALLVCLGCGGETSGGDGGLDGSVSRDGAIDAGEVVLCASDLDCSDSLYCTGDERCVPGGAGSGPDGCVAGEAPCGAGETCDETADECVRDDCVDEDGDGFDTCSGDCDDSRADINPSEEEQCVADDPTDEDCDPRTYGFVDIDMDGAADARCFNEDAAGTRFGGTDCDDNNASVSPLAAEVCDGTFDENCNGTVDEDCPCTPEGSVRDCGPDMGICTDALQTCGASGWGGCSVTPMATEICDGSLDENCDGSVDEGCECTNGDTRPCQAGVCAGTERCGGGRWGACLGADGMPAPTPGSRPETCDGIDSDCDGIADADDDSVVGIGESCGTDEGECIAGTRTCLGSALSCVGEVEPATEVCDGRDNDCNGMVNDRPGGCACTTGDSRMCGVGECVGFQSCVSGAWATCSGASPSAEICDGRDNDCDGSTDNVSGVGAACGSDVGECGAGTLSCGAGPSLVCGGPGHVATATESCNHLDDDCDSFRDDGVALSAGCVRTFTTYDGAPRPGRAGGELDLGRDGLAGAGAYARGWSGDFGRSSFYRAQIRVTTPGTRSDYWTTTMVLAPQRLHSSGATCGGLMACDSTGLPPLARGERAMAVQTNGVRLLLMSGTSDGWTVVAQSFMDTGCRDPGPAGMTYDLELFHTRGSFRATAVGTAAACGFTTVTWDSDSTWTELYGERSDYPRYRLGAVGVADTDVTIVLQSLYIDRRTSFSGIDDNCLGCD